MKQNKKRNHMKNILFISCLFLACNLSFGQKKPWWINDKPQSSTKKYHYELVYVGARENALNLAFMKYSESFGLGYKPGSINAQDDQEGRYELKGKMVRYQKVEEKNVGSSRYVLYMFRIDGKDKITNRLYRGHLVAFPLSAALPGLGQMHKRQKGKGWAFLTSTLIFGGGAYYLDTERKKYKDEFYNTSSYEEKQEYLDKHNEFQLYRNIALGVAGTVYLVNIIDAAVAKGRRLAYTIPPKPKNLKFHLDYNPTFNAPQLAVNFRF